MPTTIKYSNNPNSDTAFVVQDGGQKNRAVLTAEPAGTLQLSDSANVSTGYVTDEDGKKHKVNLVAQLEGDIEFSENPNSTKGYATVDGKKHRVVLTASLHGGGGSTPVIDELNVTPSTSAQTITAPEGTDGYSPVNVSAVTSAIDANIAAGNIKKDVTILGVTGSYEGVVPSGTKSITANGIYDVTDFASADVQVPTTAPAHYIEKTVDANGKLIGGTSVINLTGVTDVGYYALYMAYYKNNNISTNIDFSNLVNISGEKACGAAFSDCSVLTNVDLSSLINITGAQCCEQMFSSCSALTSVDLSSLKQVFMTNSCLAMFNKSVHLTNIYFPALTSSSFGSVNTQFKNLVNLVTGCSLHFPSNLDPQGGSTVISSLTGYPSFGGTNTVLLFDLPATNHLIGADTVEYERSPKFDTVTALAWRVNETNVTATTYYTSGITDPSVGGTIYSDLACTQAVTTISSIA